MIEDFKDHPQSITEIRSDKSQDGADWTPRDVLIAALRDIDSGAHEIEALVIVERTKHDKGPPGFHWRLSSPDIHISLGLLTRGIHQIQETATPADR